MYCGLNDKSLSKITPMNSKDSLDTIGYEAYDQKSLWSRPKKKLKFLSNMLSKQKKVLSIDSTIAQSR